MIKTKRNVLVIIMSLLFILNFTGCKSAEEKAMAEERSCVSTSIDEVTKGDSENTYTNLSDFAKANKGKFVQWEIEVEEFDNDYTIIDSLGDKYTTKIICKFDYKVKDKVKKDNIIVVSGKLDDWSFWSSEINLINCRIENLSEEELAKRKADREAKLKAKEEEEATAQEEAKAKKEDSKWTKDNIVSLVQKNEVLDKGMSFSDKLDGSKIYQQDSSFYGKTDIQNAYCLELTINLNEKQVLDKEVLKNTTFNIAKVINDNSTKFDFNINLVRITFGNFDKNQYGDNMNNFAIGINTIKNYFSEPRSTSVGISGATGDEKQIDFDKESFYKWIEDNFTLPEDNSVLAENNSWTTLSSKGNIK